MTDRTETAMTPNDVLDAAADVILQRGWTRDWLEEDDGAVCVLGALAVAAGRRTPTYAAIHASGGPLKGAYLALRDAVQAHGMIEWNARAESVDDVLRLLKDTRVEDVDAS